MLRSLEQTEKVDWRKHLRACVHAYNASIHQSTGYSPYYLFYGRHPTLPIDLAFGTRAGSTKQSARQFIKALKSSLQTAYKTATTNMAKMAQRNKVRYDARAHASELESGDRCLVRKMGSRIQSKVDDRWEQGVYVVLSRTDELPVYTVRREGSEGPNRTLHRNLLLPIGVLDAREPAAPPRQTSNQGLPPQRKARMTPHQSPQQEDEVPEDEAFGVAVEIEVDRQLLRPTAPEYVPLNTRGTDKAPTDDEAGAERTETEVDQEVQIELEKAPTDDEAGEERTETEVDQEVQIELEEALSEPQQPEEDAALSEDETQSESTETEGVEKSPVQRRSGRIRHPVQRLNLAHQCNVKLDAGLLESVTNTLQTILAGGAMAPAGMAANLERCLWGIHCCIPKPDIE
ncbi:hypothetical protein ACOMHN_014577 [Nucella lapillus]